MEKLAFKTLAIFLAVIVTAKALSCHVCADKEGYNHDDPEIDSLIDRSCAAGNIPSDKFSANCKNLEYYEVTIGVFIGQPKGFHLEPIAVNLSNIIAKFQVTFSCIRVTLNGKSSILDENEKGTARFCVMIKGSNETFVDRCYEEENSMIQDGIKEPWLKSAIAKLSQTLSPDTKVGICSCFSDNCN